MGFQRTHSFQKQNSYKPQPITQFNVHPVENPVQMMPQRQPTPEEMENEAFVRDKFEAQKLGLKEKDGTITPEEQERLEGVKAGMADFWAQRMERAKRLGYDFSKIPVTSPQRDVAPQLLQPKLTSSPMGDKDEQHKQNQTGMPDDVKHQFEQGFNRDFSNVRINKDSDLPVQMGAKALVRGSQIHFAPHAFEPERASGNALLGHELAHVVQQSKGEVTANTQALGHPVNTECDHEYMADQMAANAASHFRSDTEMSAQLKGQDAPLEPIPMKESGVAQLWPPKSVEEADAEIQKLEKELFEKDIEIGWTFQSKPRSGMLDKMKKSYIDKDLFKLEGLFIKERGSCSLEEDEILNALAEYTKLREWKQKEFAQQRSFGYGNVPSFHFSPPSPFQQNFSLNPFAPHLHNQPMNSSHSGLTVEDLGNDTMVRDMEPTNLENLRDTSKAYRVPGKKSKAKDSPPFEPDIFQDDITFLDEARVKRWKQEKRGQIAKSGPFKGEKWPDQIKQLGKISAQEAVLSANKAGKTNLDQHIPYEWLHLFAFSMGGKDNNNPQDPMNFVVGTQYANYYHLIFESIAKELASDHKLTIMVHVQPINPISTEWRIYGDLLYSFSIMALSQPTWDHPESIAYPKKTVTRVINCLGTPQVHASDKDTLKETILQELGIPSEKYLLAVDKMFGQHQSKEDTSNT